MENENKNLEGFEDLVPNTEPEQQEPIQANELPAKKGVLKSIGGWVKKHKGILIGGAAALATGVIGVIIGKNLNGGDDNEAEDDGYVGNAIPFGGGDSELEPERFDDVDSDTDEEEIG